MLPPVFFEQSLNSGHILQIAPLKGQVIVNHIGLTLLLEMHHVLILVQSSIEPPGLEVALNSNVHATFEFNIKL